MSNFDSKSIKRWFLREKRDLPWRENPSPYRVWVSEVMLQQTQVSVVVGYFERWMDSFPTIQSLADASLDEVIKMWEGLGYYSRARNLHEGAKLVRDKFGGELPSDHHDLSQIKGLGPYTIGAIRSFAFHQKTSAVDGNVIRVLARYYALEEDIGKPRTLNKIRELAENLLPDEEPWIVNEALIELGATLCSRKPKCQACPLRSSCEAYQQGKAELLPYKSTKIKTQNLYRAVAVIRYGNQFLVRRGQKGEIMSDLHEFPYFDVAEDGIEHKQLIVKIRKELGLAAIFMEEMPSVSHSFTKYQVRLDPVMFRIENCQEAPGYEWMGIEALKKLAFSSGHRRIFVECERTTFPSN